MDITLDRVHIPDRRGHAGLRFNAGEYVPQPGETVVMCFSTGYYAITIHRITRRRQHEDGATLLDVDCTRRLVVNMTMAESEGD